MNDNNSQTINKFLDYLLYNRKMSSSTIRAYRVDLVQYSKFLMKATKEKSQVRDIIQEVGKVVIVCKLKVVESEPKKVEELLELQNVVSVEH